VACAVDYLDVSDAASVKLDVLTVSAPQRDEIQAWMTIWIRLTTGKPLLSASRVMRGKRVSLKFQAMQFLQD
jgi:hypothetical protein